MRCRWQLLVAGLFCALLTGLAWAGESKAAATRPTQPKSGPGSSDYKHRSVTKSAYEEDEKQYWIYEPANPKPAKAPVVILMHGWLPVAPSPDHYLGWIEHLVKRGNIVIFPRYQKSIETPPDRFLPNTVTAVQQALQQLQKDGHVKPDLGRCAIAGHSFGGVLSANLAAVAAKNGLPQLKAVMCVEPGTNGFGKYEDYARIPSKTLLLCIAGADDLIVRDTDARRIFKETTGVAKGDKNLIVIQSDAHGKPPISSDHFAPVGGVDNAHPLQWYGFWKWLDALTDAAFYDQNRKFALGNTAEQRFMGKWSDGQPVVEPRVIEEP